MRPIERIFLFSSRLVELVGLVELANDLSLGVVFFLAADDEQLSIAQNLLTRNP